mmetsp:Transcript_17559/g.47504  ORF Transcript_17559/g.47504 Transcript_17559/m.47504 type:complete len:267 (+) Transcript_17559:826-1626(+)
MLAHHLQPALEPLLQPALEQRLLLLLVRQLPLQLLQVRLQHRPLGQRLAAELLSQFPHRVLVLLVVSLLRLQLLLHIALQPLLLRLLSVERLVLLCDLVPQPILLLLALPRDALQLHLVLRVLAGELPLKCSLLAVSGHHTVHPRMQPPVHLRRRCQIVVLVCAVHASRGMDLQGKSALVVTLAADHLGLWTVATLVFDNGRRARYGSHLGQPFNTEGAVAVGLLTDQREHVLQSFRRLARLLLLLLRRWWSDRSARGRTAAVHFS